MRQGDPAAGAQSPHLFPHTVGRPTPRAVRGEGVWVWDDEGNRYLDADSGAISVVSIGHGRTEVADAVRAQAAELAYVHNGQFSNRTSEELAAELAEFAPGDLDWSMFVSGGSEANETASKLARAYHLATGNPSKHLIVSRRRSYHGATLGALSLSGIPARSAPYRPMLPPEHKIAEVHCARCPFGLAYPSCRLACAADLERAIEEHGAGSIAAFIAEPIVAAAAPAATPPPGYFERIREICDRHAILFIADEVVTGCGRTGRGFGFEHWDAVPDIVVTAKGLSGGYAPLGAVLMRDRVATAFFDAGSPFTNGLTYEAHPVGCAAALAVLRIIRGEDLVENAARQGEALESGLRELARRHPTIGEVRGKGLLLGLELVADAETLKPFPPRLEVAQRLRTYGEARGVMVYAGVRTHQRVGDAVLVTPPLCISGEEVRELLERLDLALDDLAADLRAEGVALPA